MPSALSFPALNGGACRATDQNWVRVLKEDPKEIVRAAREAKKIKSMVMGFEKEKAQKTEKDPELGQATTLPFKLAEKVAQGFDNEQDRCRFLARVQERLADNSARPSDIRIKEVVAVKGDLDMGALTEPARQGLAGAPPAQWWVSREGNPAPSFPLLPSQDFVRTKPQ